MDKKAFETKDELELDAAEMALENASQQEVAASQGLTSELTAGEVKLIKKDRMRFVTNKLSSTLALIGILLNVFYFVSIYKSDPIGSSFYYRLDIGLSVLINLAFMLAVFLSSEGVKNYNKKFAIALVVIGVLEIARIFFLPMTAHNEMINVDGGEATRIMSDAQFIRVVIYLVVAGACLIVSGVVGIIRSKMLTDYKKSLEQQSA